MDANPPPCCFAPKTETDFRNSTVCPASGSAIKRQLSDQNSPYAAKAGRGGICLMSAHSFLGFQRVPHHKGSSGLGLDGCELSGNP